MPTVDIPAFTPSLAVRHISNLMAWRHTDKINTGRPAQDNFRGRTRSSRLERESEFAIRDFSPRFSANSMRVRQPRALFVFAHSNVYASICTELA